MSVPADARPISMAPGYFVSPSGGIFNASGHEMAQRIPARYVHVGLRVNGKTQVFKVHRLVAYAFHGDPPKPSCSVDHIDRNPQNNASSNLRWATPTEQAANRNKSRSNNERPIAFTATCGKRIEFKSVTEASTYFGLRCMSMLYRAIGKGKIYHGGTWEHMDTARAGVTYRPIPGDCMSGELGYSAGDDGSILTPHGRVTFGRLVDDYMVLSMKNGAYRVHRLIASVFLPKDDTRPLVNHINGVKNDNRVQNLERVTARENSRHAHDTGLIKRAVGKKVVGTRDGVETTFVSLKEAARCVGGSACNIGGCLKGRQKTSCGYTWSAVD